MTKPFHQTRLYHTWEGMKARCYYEKAENYSRYGGRGIEVCEEWKSDFKEFQKWAIANGYRDTLQVDRIDNDGDYEPNNCRWVTHTENNNNRSNNKRYTINGETLTHAQWCKRYDMNYMTVRSRMVNKGWDFEKALTTPLDTKYMSTKRKIQMGLDK